MTTQLQSHSPLDRAPRTKMLMAGAVLAGAMALVGWGGTGEASAASKFEPVTSDTLTIATWSLPYSGYFNGQTPDGDQTGFGWELANALAQEFGMTKVSLVMKNFSATTAGLSTGYDLAAFASPTPERQKVGQYTQCILPNESVAFVRKGTKVDTIEDLKNLQWGVSQGSAPGAVVTNGVKPTKEPRVYNGMVTLVPSLLTGQIEAAVGSVADFAPYFKSPDFADYQVAVQMKYESAKTSNQCQAMQLPMNSPNLAAVNAVIDKLRAEGKLDQWMSEYVVPAMGGVDLRDVPLVTISE